MPRLREFYPGICLTTEEKGRKNLSQVKRSLSQYTFYQNTHTLQKPTHPHIHTHTHTHYKTHTRTHTHTHVTKQYKTTTAQIKTNLLVKFLISMIQSSQRGTKLKVGRNQHANGRKSFAMPSSPFTVLFYFLLWFLFVMRRMWTGTV